MNINPQIILDFTKVISEQNKIIENPLVVNNSSKNKSEPYIIQLDSGHLTINISRNDQWSKENKQQTADQLSKLELNKKFYNQICKTNEFKTAISEDNLDGLLQLKGGDLSPLTKTLFKILLIWTMCNNSITTKGFMSGQNNPGFGHPTRPTNPPKTSRKPD